VDVPSKTIKEEEKCLPQKSAKKIQKNNSESMSSSISNSDFNIELSAVNNRRKLEQWKEVIPSQQIQGLSTKSQTQ
jgi:hypothetical protein